MTKENMKADRPIVNLIMLPVNVLAYVCLSDECFVCLHARSALTS